jgi:hypothetical protein
MTLKMEAAYSFKTMVDYTTEQPKRPQYRVWEKWCIITTVTGRKPQNKTKL